MTRATSRAAIPGHRVRGWRHAQAWSDPVNGLGARRSNCSPASLTGWPWRTRRASCIATSSPITSWSAKSGYAKLADFGLAKLAEGASTDLTRTLTEGRTRPGVIIGTIPYMSPEQASGKPVDARSDIFSFGVLLYEMLGGGAPSPGRPICRCCKPSARPGRAAGGRRAAVSALRRRKGAGERSGRALSIHAGSGGRPEARHAPDGCRSCPPRSGAKPSRSRLEMDRDWSGGSARDRGHAGWMLLGPKSSAAAGVSITRHSPTLRIRL